MREDKKILATPKVRKFARELGANVSDLKGTERKGRVTEYDVKNYIANELNSEKEKFTKELIEWIMDQTREKSIPVYVDPKKHHFSFY